MIEYENLHLLNRPFFDEYRSSFDATLARGWFILGKNVEVFENEFAAYCSARHCIGVASGLDALMLSIKALALPTDAEILVPANTYIATILAILQCGHVPVLVEPDIHTYNIDPQKIERHITPKTKALMIVHLYGKLCNMDALLPLVEKYGLKLIEDCAQAHGAHLRGKKAGTFGHCNAFSFYPTKNLGALGDAGAVVTNDTEIAERVRTLRNYGSKVKYINELIGYNSRLDELQAGFLSVKLRALDAINDHKRTLARLYHEGISDRFAKPVVHPDYHDVFHIYNIRHPRRDALREFLLQKNIKTEIHYPLAPHRQAALQDMFSGKTYPVTDEIHSTTLSLPISYFHSPQDVSTVIKALNEFE